MVATKKVVETAVNITGINGVLTTLEKSEAATEVVL